jgi:hypothetical protein
VIVVPLVIIGVGVPLLTRRQKTIRRLNDLGTEHPLCRQATVEIDATPELVLLWARSAARSAQAHDIVIDSEEHSLWAETSTTLVEGGRIITIRVEPLSDRRSQATIYSWPTRMVKHDRGTGQYFVDRFAQKLLEIANNPLHPLAPATREKWG